MNFIHLLLRIDCEIIRALTRGFLAPKSKPIKACKGNPQAVIQEPKT